MSRTSGGLALPGVVARTPLAGVALINGTPTLLSWTAPNDGVLHIVEMVWRLNVTSPETGGELAVNYTLGGTVQQLNFINSGLAVSLYDDKSGANNNSARFVIDPNTTFSIQQFVALTGGAATFFGVLLAA